MDDESRTTHGVTRRGMLTGVSAAVLAGSLASAKPAGATPASPGRSGSDGVGVPMAAAHPDGSPITTTIASPPLPNRTYRFVGMYDFFPFNPAAGKTWGGSGTYSSGTATSMRATLEIPPGALVAEVEYYIYNSSGADVTPDTFVEVAGQGTISSIGATVTIPSNASAIAAAQATVPSTGMGPYPFASRLLVSVSTPSTGTVQINGARVAFLHGGGTVGLLRVPVRAYDSRAGHSKLAAGHARTITLPATVLLPGVTGVLANVTALNPSGNGHLKVYRGDIPAPKPATLYYDGATATTQIEVEVSTSGRIKVLSSKTTDVVIDILGTVS
jgi:hypothetical protein